jgi:hypothetical protein
MINKNIYNLGELAKDIHQDNDVVMILKEKDIFCNYKNKIIPKYYYVINFNQKRIYFIHFKHLKKINGN